MHDKSVILPKNRAVFRVPAFAAFRRSALEL
jgi:hypothetical protein